MNKEMEKLEAYLQDILKKADFDSDSKGIRSHRDEIFSAIRIIFQCGLMARESGLLAFDIYANPEWYEDEIESLESMEDAFGCEIPLKEFFQYSLGLLAFTYNPKLIAKLMIQKSLVNQYTGWQAYVVYVYLKGILAVWSAMIPEEIEVYFRTTVSEVDWQAYDAFVNNKL